MRIPMKVKFQNRTKNKKAEFFWAGRCPSLIPQKFWTFKPFNYHQIHCNNMLTEFYKDYNKERIIKIALKINILQWFLKFTNFSPFWPFYSNGRGYNPQNQYICTSLPFMVTNIILKFHNNPSTTTQVIGRKQNFYRRRRLLHYIKQPHNFLRSYKNWWGPFLAHLAEGHVSYWHHSVSVVRRCRRPSSVNF